MILFQGVLNVYCIFWIYSHTHTYTHTHTHIYIYIIVVLHFYPLPRPQSFPITLTQHDIVLQCKEYIYSYFGKPQSSHILSTLTFSSSAASLKKHILWFSQSHANHDRWSPSLPNTWCSVLALHKPPLNHCPVYAARNQELRRSWFINTKIVIREDHEPNSQSCWFGTWVWLLLSLRVMGYCICGFTELLVCNICSTLFLNF
jgi:hypothetical protein